MTSSFGVTPSSDPVEDKPTVQDTTVEPDVETPIEVESKAVTDQADHLYSYEIDERKKADVTGVYYDDLKRMEAEQQRARVEKREPDYDTMGGIASTPLLRMTERPSEPTS